MLILRLHLDPVPARGFSASPDALERERISYCYRQTLSTIVGIEQRHYDYPPPLAYLPGRRFCPPPAYLLTRRRSLGTCHAHYVTIDSSLERANEGGWVTDEIRAAAGLRISQRKLHGSSTRAN